MPGALKEDAAERLFAILKENYFENEEIIALVSDIDSFEPTLRGRIAGIGPKDYTRMGAPIRHSISILKEAPARIRLLIVIDDARKLPSRIMEFYRKIAF